ncbi:hypothetical protein CDD83_4171 [Cordyceps sp. RAO-2017]|nr:hypothetical protein CDD83_4171 [Cordyceps sp. RAO-2017]
MHNIASNLGAMAKDLEDAQDKSEKLSRKGAKASAQKVDAASSRLESSTQQWESQAPFVFETLQALDESRVNQLRDLLTQYQTHEADQAQRAQNNAVEALAAMLEISTEKEVRDFAQRTTGAKPPASTRPSVRRMSFVTGGGAHPRQPTAPDAPSSLPGGPTDSAASPGPPAPTNPPTPGDDDASDQNSFPADAKPGSKLRRLGTMLGGRRRQSVHGGFGGLTPQRTGPANFGRLGSSHGRVSPRPSTSNLNQDSGRLSALAETPDRASQDETAADQSKPAHEGTNGVTAGSDSLLDAPSPAAAAAPGMNGTHAADVIDDVPPPPGPPPGQLAEAPPALAKDSEGFTVRAPMNDPISEAQRDAAADEADQPFKLNIQNQPVEEEDPEAKMAALSSVANSLKVGPATRRSSTIRGRRDVRNTIYVHTPTSSVRESQSDSAMPSIAGSPPATSSSFSRPPALAALASEASIAGTSDTQSVRSGNSLGSLPHAKHPDMTGPGLNSSIIETVSAVFEGGVVKSASIAGEIALQHNAPDPSGKMQSVIRINNFASLERIGPNRIFVQNSSSDQPDQFTVDVSHLARTSIAFSYRVFAEEAETPALGRHAPLLLKPAWKPQGDKLGLLLQYQLNPSAQFASPTTLHNVVFVARYEGKATSAQTKPSGTHLKDKHLVYWRLGDVTLTGDVQKIVCRIAGADGAAPVPGHVEARWEYAAAGGEARGSGISLSRLDDDGDKGAEDDPFADQSQAIAAAAGQTWVDVPAQRRLVSGKYEGR